MRHYSNQWILYSALLLTFSLAACQQPPLQSVQPTPLPQDDLIQVYMNHEPAASYTEPYRQQTRPGDDLERVIVESITQAQSTIDVAVQELRLPNITSALVKQHKAGVKVRVILENTYSRPFSSFSPEEVAKLPEREHSRYQEAQQLIDLNGDGQLSQAEIAQRDALVMLDQAGVPRIDDTADGSSGSNLMHHKIVVIDRKTVIVTSANFTTSDVHGDFKSPTSQGNANNMLKIASSKLATLFTQEFNTMWGDGPGGKPDSRFGIKKPFQLTQQLAIGKSLVEVHFSPSSKSIPWERSSNGLIGKMLKSATRTIDMALFVFSDQQLVNQLETSHRRGVEIRALIDPGFAYRPYSEALDMLGIALAEQCRFELTNRLWQPPITTVGVPRLPPGDLLHHKFGLIDQQTVITGSHNWTDAANNGNDETVIVVQNPTVAAHYQREFDRLYADAILGIPPAIQKKVDRQKQECQSRQSRLPSPVTAISHDQTTKPNLPQVTKPLPQAKRPKPSKASPASSQRVNLNTATQAELESLPGVGPALAKRIIATRQQKSLASLQDLDKVPGVGSKLLKNLQDRVTF